MILVAVWWLGAAHLVGAAFWPVVFRFLHPFADRGLGLAMPAGLLAFGLVSWWIGVTGLATNGPVTSLVVIGVIAVGAWGLSATTRREMMEFWRRRRGLLIIQAAVTTGTFLGMLWLRSFASDINGTEKFMDFAFLNAVARSDTFPPIDPWLAPSPTMPDPRINYYYFGYLCHGLLIQLTGVAPSEGFNLSLALVFAMVASGTSSVGYTLAREQVAHWSGSDRGGAGRTPLPVGDWSFGVAVPYLVVGAVSAMVVLVAGNLWSVLRRFDGSGLWEKDFWTGIGWNATRVLVIKEGDRDIDYTINEFPAFSFLLGDLHPHVLTLPFAVLAVAVAYRWFIDPPLPFLIAAGGSRTDGYYGTGREGIAQWRRALDVAMPYCSAAMVAAFLGSLYFSNSWDFPTYLILVVGAGVIGASRARPAEPTMSFAIGLARLAYAALAVSAVALLAVAPFVAGFSPPVVAAPGELPVGMVQRRSVLGQFLEFWGLQLLWLAPVALCAGATLTGGGARRRVIVAVGASAAAAAAIALAEVRSLGTYAVGVFAGTLAVAVASRILPRARPASKEAMVVGSTPSLPVPRPAPAYGGRATGFAFLVAALAFALLAACEVVFLRDFYGGSLRRMNTVFKLYYQAWLLIGLAAPQLAFWTWLLARRAWPAIERGAVASTGPFFRQLPVVLLTWWGVIIVGMLFYPVHVIGLRTHRLSGQASIDGMDWLRRFHPDDHAAAQWLLENATDANGERAPVILEATGGAYSEFARVSTQTGFPTILGWDQHERLWRGETSNAEVERRRQDVEQFYRHGAGPVAREVLERYGVAFVVKGYLEEQAYAGPGLDALDDPGSGLIEVFRRGQTAIYATDIPPRLRTADPVTVPPVRNVR